MTITQPVNSIALIFNRSFLLMIVAAIGLGMTIRVNYLLFHTLAELFSIVIAFSLFIIAWNAKEYIRNSYLLFVGIAYFFIGFIDLLHTIAYKGMPIFTDYDYYANQLWIGARYLESATLIVAFVSLKREKMLKVSTIFATYTVITSLLVASIFIWKIFPECFIDGSGLTPFKKNSEYIICALLTVSIYLLHKNRDRFEKTIYQLILWSIICTIISELAFTFYISNYGFSNIIGHYFKIFSFSLIYISIIQTGIKNPYNLVFLELNKTNKKLLQEIDIRKRTETELQKSLDEIKTLRGILPLCSFCKKIRDDSGYWEQVDVYIHKHFEADISHSICQECLKEHYPKEYEELYPEEA